LKLSYLDKLFSEFIRKRAMKNAGGCQRCKMPKLSHKNLQACHFHGRRKRSIRFDEDNAAGLCAGCHMYLDSQPIEKIEFFRNLLGQEAFDKLNTRAQFRHKVDEAATILYLREKLKELEL